jgi:hypothetical protein
VLRFYPERREGSGDYRVNLTKDPSWGWEETFITINGGDERKFDYLVTSNRAQFNTTGWPKMAYLGMCGNEVNILERVPGWVRFQTLKPQDWHKARSMSRVTHPTLIHTFTCITWDRETQTTKRIPTTGTPRGMVDFPLVTWEGYGWIPSRFVIRIS